MNSRDPHGDDTIWLIGGIFVALINLVIVIPIRLVIDLIRERRGN